MTFLLSALLTVSMFACVFVVLAILKQPAGRAVLHPGRKGKR